MLTDKEFNDAFTAVGGKFFAKNYEYLVDNEFLPTANLVDNLYQLGYDSNKNGTRTRVSSAKRLLSENHGKRALIKIAMSTKIERSAVEIAIRILHERFK